MSDIAIRVENLSKRYRIGAREKQANTLRERIENLIASPFEYLRGTLLKILSRITVPTEGTAEVDGRVGSLLEVGTGFHPELTGRENIYMNGAILGMRRAEINKKFDEIVAFV